MTTIGQMKPTSCQDEFYALMILKKGILLGPNPPTHTLQPPHRQSQKNIKSKKGAPSPVASPPPGPAPSSRPSVARPRPTPPPTDSTPPLPDRPASHAPFLPCAPTRPAPGSQLQVGVRGGRRGQRTVRPPPPIFSGLSVSLCLSVSPSLYVRSVPRLNAPDAQPPLSPPTPLLLTQHPLPRGPPPCAECGGRSLLGPRWFESAQRLRPHCSGRPVSTPRAVSWFRSGSGSPTESESFQNKMKL